MNKLADLARRIESMMKIGVIHSIDYTKQRVQVKSGEIITDWLAFVTQRTGKTQTWSPPTIGEQCIIFSPSGELTTGIVMTGIYTDNAPSTSPDEHVIHFEDGATITYNHKSHDLTVKGVGTATIQASKQILLDAPVVHCTGKVTSVEDMVAGGISQINHLHNGVSSGQSKTGKPV